MEQNETLLILRCKLFFDAIFWNEELRRAFLEHAGPYQYDCARETWYLLHDLL